jgi:diacylglycerol kinase family enzyme
VVQRYLGSRYDLNWLQWQKGHSGTAQIRAALQQRPYDAVVAVGGDGTVNQAAAALANHSIALGIVPRGSGNGLARHLGVPLALEGALGLLARGRPTVIDSARISSRRFFCTAGIGFDAHIGQCFAEAPRRGFLTYARLVLREFLNYRPQTYDLVIDGRPLTVRAYLITFGNAAQWGNNAHIAPLADIQDGLLHISILGACRRAAMPLLVVRLFKRSLHRSPHVRSLSGRTITVHPHAPGYFHYDGEPQAISGELGVQIYPGSLRVILSPDWRGAG